MKSPYLDSGDMPLKVNPSYICNICGASFRLFNKTKKRRGGGRVFPVNINHMRKTFKIKIFRYCSKLCFDKGNPVTDYMNMLKAKGYKRI